MRPSCCPLNACRNRSSDDSYTAPTAHGTGHSSIHLLGHTTLSCASFTFLVSSKMTQKECFPSALLAPKGVSTFPSSNMESLCQQEIPAASSSLPGDIHTKAGCHTVLCSHGLHPHTCPASTGWMAAWAHGIIHHERNCCSYLAQKAEPQSQRGSNLRWNVIVEKGKLQTWKISAAGHAATAQRAKSRAEIQNTCVWAQPMALGARWPGGPLHLSVLIFQPCSLWVGSSRSVSELEWIKHKAKQLFAASRKTNVEKKYGYQQNSHQQGQRRII